MSARHVYVHVPFCARRCVYCDFAIAVRRSVPIDEFIHQVRREISLRFPSPPQHDVRSIYFGGGTPSRLGGDGVARLLDAVTERWTPADGAEVTIEANPDDVDDAVARAWRAAGVNRVSLGVQSFSTKVLRWMHRTHDVDAVWRARDAIRDAGIPSLSIDLIFALPDAITRSWDEDLERAVALAPDHVSCYGLTFESGTPLDRARQRGDVLDPPEASYADEFLKADEVLVAAGFEHYEVSNYARPGGKAMHNSAYWERVPYVGLGPSAHEFIGGVRRWNVPEYAHWARALERGDDPVQGSELVTGESALLEGLFLALRTSSGVAWDPRDAEIVDTWLAQGWATVAEGRLKLTANGWLRMNALVTALTQRRSRY